MRIRFSLRTAFVLLTALTGFCYLWLTLPTQVARRFAGAVNGEDFQSADQFFIRVDDRFLAEWADSRWAFDARCELRPLTLAQLLTARRLVDVQISYFEFDHTATRAAKLAATPFGLTTPSLSSVNYGGRIIDEVREAARPMPRQ